MAAVTLGLAVTDAQQAPSVRLALLMMVRDEEQLIREHLPLWLPLAWCLVGAVDERTNDSSARAFIEVSDASPWLIISNSSGLTRRRRFLFWYTFVGLGAARSELVYEACVQFPDATHALFVDPDWRPVAGPRTPSLQSLAAVVDVGRHGGVEPTVFAFRVFDRNRVSERLLDWCFRLDPGVRFKYRWHEVLVFPPYMAYVAHVLAWDVEEVAGADAKSYHATQHGHVASVARYEFEIGLLQLDLADAETTGQDDSRLHYYLGVDYIALADAHRASGHDALEVPRQTRLYETARAHLERHIEMELSLRGNKFGGSAQGEMTYVAMLQSALAAHRLGLAAQAEARIRMAEQYDPERAEAPVQLARLCIRQRRFSEAFEAAERAASLPMPVRSFYHHPTAYSDDASSTALAAAVSELRLADPTTGHCKPCPLRRDQLQQQLLWIEAARRHAGSLLHRECIASRCTLNERNREAAEAHAACVRRCHLSNRGEESKNSSAPTLALDTTTSGESFLASVTSAPQATARSDGGGDFFLQPCAVRTTSEVVRAVKMLRNDPVAAVKLLQAASIADRYCCKPYREFSRIFLGEVPTSASLNETARRSLESALASDLSNVDNDDSWREQLAYAVASLRQLIGNTSAAGSALRFVFSESASFRQAAASPRQMTDETALAIVTVASTETETLSNLRQSAAAAGQSLIVLGLGADYTGHETKLRFYHDWLKSRAEIAPASLVLLVDAYDIVIWPSIQEFRSRFLSFEADIVFGADPTCFPDLAVAQFYDDATISDGPRFLNSGTIAGTAGALLSVLRAAVELGPLATCGPDDQRAFHRIYLQGVSDIVMKIDASGVLFHSLHRELRDLVVRARLNHPFFFNAASHPG